jgi:hypothetical protein
MKYFRNVIVFTIVFFSINSCNYFGRKAETLTLIEEAMDFENPIVRNYAVNLASNSKGEFNIGQICEIYNHLKTNWKYVNDPKGKEFFSSASNSIQAGLSGDCDDFAILMATLIRSIGGEVRVSFAYNKEAGHAFTEVLINQEILEIRRGIESYYSKKIKKQFGKNTIGTIGYRENGNEGVWLNLDWQSNFPGGEYYDYDKCDIFYPISNNHETVLRGDNLIKNIDGTKSKYTKQEISKFINKTIILDKEEVVDIEPTIVFTDLDEDKNDEMIVYYSVSGGGNATLQRLILFTTNDNKFEYLTHFDFTGDYWNTYIKHIKNNVIYCKQYVYKDDDPRCCPSIEKEVKFQFVNANNQLQLEEIE